MFRKLHLIFYSVNYRKLPYLLSYRKDFFFFWLQPWHVEVPGPRTEPAPQLQPVPQLQQCWILNLLSHMGISRIFIKGHLFSDEITC